MEGKRELQGVTSNMTMERQRNQENPSTHLPANYNPSIKQESPRKPSLGGDHRLKRDEWSEGAVASLLEAYESKWILRNRAKLKGQDWEDVARHVSSRANSTKTPKTQTQCKNKIESMKKRYRSESATAGGADNTASSSSWPLYSRLDNLLRGGNGAAGTGNHPSPVSPTPIQHHQPPPPPEPQPHLPCGSTASPNNNNSSGGNQALILMEEKSPALQPPKSVQPAETAQNSHESGAAAPGLSKEDGCRAAKPLSDDQVSESDRNLMETSTSTPAALYSDKERLNMKKPTEKIRKTKKKKQKSTMDNNNVADSIRWLAEAMVRSEQVRMDGMRELEAMRVEAEVKRGEMDLKRTEIIANTQLDIAKIFAAVAGKGVDSSLRIGRN